MQVVKTGSIDTEPSFFIDKFPFYTVKNVVSIEAHHTGFSENDCVFGWNVVKKSTEECETISYYLYFDTKNHDAFSHWVFESAIFLPLFNKIKEKYPSLKILIKEQKNFKLSFFKAFHLENDVVCALETHDNLVIFPRYTTHHIRKRNELYKELLDPFYSYFIQNEECVKDIDILYLPRGTRENYKGWDRKIDCQEQLIEYIQSLPNTMVYNTDLTDNFVDQVKIIRRAKKILLDYGSSFNVNGFFAKQSEIIIIGHDVHHEIFPILQMGIERMEQNGNTFRYIYKEGQTNGTVNTYHFSFEKVLHALQGNN